MGNGPPRRPPPPGALTRRPPTSPAPAPRPSNGTGSSALVQNAETARALVPGRDPRAIVQAFTRHPFRVGKRVEVDPALAVQHGGGQLVARPDAHPRPDPNNPGQNLDYPSRVDQLEPGHMIADLKAPEGIGLVTAVTPEVLLAIVVSLIATSKNATEACVRIRQEVAGWTFQTTSGVVV